jgi:hypothetical protein
VQRPLTSGPREWPTGQVLCRFGPWLCAHVSTREGEGQGGGESQRRTNHIVGRPRGWSSCPPLGELLT